MEEHVKFEQKGRIGYVILSRPEKRNALNAAMVSGLQAALDRCEAIETVKVVIIKAEGKVFCSGADLQDIERMQDNTFDENLADSEGLKKLFLRLYTFPKVVIAQVQGHALAGGCGLVSVCDFAYAVPTAKLGYTEVRIGFVPAMVLVFLVRKLGEGKAKELLLTGELLVAPAAKEIGLIQEVFEPAALDGAVQEIAERLISQNSGESMALTKKMIAAVQDLPLEEALEYAARMNAKARETEDCKRGIAAFLGKKKIEW
ncbi:enoyl-CoA hydratase/isomerase family protein [Echinicola vietnamensis]|uniref:Enoyl-CoA hydratase/carnithine racemase n=1 Tax=Echinicola vietnamensis (strain DSM 17526 / LMG 23754 / KMM 6221) TaxID=926556 RepID=L0FRT6_ECHVK|nr:enoyl-CoA hydratase-related protein [Echinicola vietnamensis]AGA76634.1 enoyl-CoA hydratase/carnithine racemase [Echinicola vietnamensis DSM 17526]